MSWSPCGRGSPRKSCHSRLPARAVAVCRVKSDAAAALARPDVRAEAHDPVAQSVARAFAEAVSAAPPLTTKEAFRALAVATRRAALEREQPALAAFERSGGTIDYMTYAQRAEFRAATRPLAVGVTP